MEESDPGKSGIQELVQGFAAGLGIDPTKLLFKWDQTRLVLPEHGLELDEPVLNLSVYLGKKSVVLSFSEELVRSSADDAYAFVTKYTDYVITALRKLKRPDNDRAGK